MGSTSVSRADLAEILRVSAPTVDAWIRRGLPVAKKGGRGRAYEFDLADVIAWRVEQAETNASAATEVVDFEEARARKTAAEAEIAEADARQRRGELVEIDTVAEILETRLSTVRLRLLAVPAKVAPRVAPIRATAKIRRILEDEFSDVLDELTSGDEFAAGASERERERRTRKAGR